MSAFVSCINLCVTTNLIISYLCWSRLQSMKDSMSVKTHNVQKQFSYMLMCQILYPILAMALPIIFYFSCFALDWGNDVDIVVIQKITMYIVMSYPLFSVLFNFYFIKCYRMYLMRLVFRFSRKNGKSDSLRIRSSFSATRT